MNSLPIIARRSLYDGEERISRLSGEDIELLTPFIPGELLLPELALLVDDVLRKRAKASLDEGNVMERIRIETGARKILDRHEEFAVSWVEFANLWFAELEDRQSIAEEGSGSFVQERVPYA